MQPKMKKLLSWTMGFAILLFGIVIYLSLYKPLEDFYDFPVPKNAKVVQENEKVKNYTWSEESEENGIPLGYELVLKLNGWEKGERDGASVIYTQRNHKIDLIFTSKHLTIIKVR